MRLLHPRRRHDIAVVLRRDVPKLGQIDRGQRRRRCHGRLPQRARGLIGVPKPESPSSAENNGILLDLHSNRGAMGYGIEAFNKRNPLAWPSFATADDVEGLPPTVINVNECDPLRDEGINFYRLLLRAGVPARCRQMMGTMNGTEIFTIACPEISRDTARDLAAFCTG